MILKIKRWEVYRCVGGYGSLVFMLERRGVLGGLEDEVYRRRR